jgi:hypothetical protein
MQVSTADYVVRVQDRGKDFQVTTKAGQVLAEVRSRQAPLHTRLLHYVKGFEALPYQLFAFPQIILYACTIQYTPDLQIGVRTALNFFTTRIHMPHIPY